VDSQVRALILKMADGNPLWALPRFTLNLEVAGVEPAAFKTVQLCKLFFPSTLTHSTRSLRIFVQRICSGSTASERITYAHWVAEILAEGRSPYESSSFSIVGLVCTVVPATIQPQNAVSSISTHHASFPH
jgi:hypothetical protein